MSVSLEVSIDLNVTPHGDDALPLDQELDGVMEQLVALAETADSGISDPAMSFDATSNLLTVELTATAGDFDEAAALADSSVRSAIHAAGGRTPRWTDDVPEFTAEKRSQHAERLDA